MLDPSVTYLNHGSFGACPEPIFNSLINWQEGFIGLLFEVSLSSLVMILLFSLFSSKLGVKEVDENVLIPEKTYIFFSHTYKLNTETLINAQGTPGMDKKELLKTITEKYNTQTSPYYAASRLWIDAIIDPLETRKIISMGIEAANNAPIKEAYNPGVIQS